LHVACHKFDKILTSNTIVIVVCQCQLIVLVYLAYITFRHLSHHLSRP
jgi:hypothetical protein